MGVEFFPKIESFFCYFSTVPSRSVIFVSYFFLVCIAEITSQECAFVDDCKCEFSNGSVIDLTSLGYHGEPRWKDVKPSLTNDTFTYSYNPCFKFSIGNGDCENVLVCQSGAKGEHYNIGNRALFSGNGENGITKVSYATDGLRRTTVTLVCSPGDTVPRLNVTGELSTNSYVMTMWSKCACADLCSNHLSAGSVLVILLMICIALYLVLGIVHSSLTRGAHGWELIPNYEFWSDFPLLVRDGCVFVINGCKPETAYERI